MSDIFGAPGAAPSPGGGAAIKDVTIETFENDVLAASMTQPVIVDFWAPWCGPCKTLTPILEKAVTDAGGQVLLAKIDIDKNQMLASQLRIQSVPTVYAFFQGRPVDGFQGAVPESEVKAFVDRLLALPAGGQPGQPNFEEIVSAAEAALEAGQTGEAAEAFASLAQAINDPEDAVYLRALAGLAACHLALGDADQARQVVEMAPEEKRNEPAFARITAALALAQSDVDQGELAGLAQAAADPANHEARFAYAEALISAGQMEAGVDALLAMIGDDREWNEGAARQKLLTVFDALGPKDPLTGKARRRLSSILFS